MLTPTTMMTPSSKPKYLDGVTPYHWLVFVLASLGWLFDCTGQRIFVLAREPALRELLGSDAGEGDVRYWGGLATFILMVGWATGGILFGIVSDRYGRVKAMVATLFAFTVFTGLSGLASSAVEFLAYRFPCGLGVGGMFGAATTLIAESVPPRFRALALGLMQTLSACGNMLASILSFSITPGTENVLGTWSGWQLLFFVGVVPVILAIPMILGLREPEPWKLAKIEAAKGAPEKRVGRLADLFGDARWRRSTIVGVCLGMSGMVGLWGIAFFSPELVTTALKERPLGQEELLRPDRIRAELAGSATPVLVSLRDRIDRKAILDSTSVDPLLRELNTLILGESLYSAKAFEATTLKRGTQKLAHLVESGQGGRDVAFLNRQILEQVFPGAISELQPTIDNLRSRGTLLQDVGSLLGMLSFTFLATRSSRRAAFLAAFGSCLVIVPSVFYALGSATDILWMLPLMGFGTMSCFAGYAIYFPELFPTRLRGTGVGFCYNTVRYLAAPFPFLLGWLSTTMPFRSVAIGMSAIYLVGILALLWAPETKDQPLPES